MEPLQFPTKFRSHSIRASAETKRRSRFALFGGRRNERAPEGCEPEVFAEQVCEYLERARDLKATVSLQSDSHTSRESKVETVDQATPLAEVTAAENESTADTESELFLPEEAQDASESELFKPEVADTTSRPQLFKPATPAS